MLFTPGVGDAAAPLTVVLGYDLAEATSPNGPVKKLLANRRRVLVADLRGMGETTPDSGRPGLLGDCVPEAYLALHLGRPLLGQRVGDLLAVLAALADESPGGFALEAHGAAGPIALHAAALEPKVFELTLDGAITSWAEVVRTPLSQDQFANVVPNALASYDLPDLAASLAPRRLNIQSAVDPTGRPLSLEQAEAAYAGARGAYRGNGGVEALTVEAGPAGSRGRDRAERRRHFLGRTCSNRNTPFLFAVTMSRRPSPLKSRTSNWVPMPLWSSISCGSKLTLPSAPAAASEPVEAGRLSEPGSLLPWDQNRLPVTRSFRPSPSMSAAIKAWVSETRSGKRSWRAKVGSRPSPRPARTTRCRTGAPSWR